jgi:23S rRNA (pseudouridine1915-N3)-methyltransferase
MHPSQLGSGDEDCRVHAVGRMKAGPENGNWPIAISTASPRLGLAASAWNSPASPRSPESRRADRGSANAAARRPRLAQTHLPEPDTALLLLDERGKNLSSEEFAAQARPRCATAARATAVDRHRRPDGHDPALRDTEQPNWCISFGAMPPGRTRWCASCWRAALPRRDDPGGTSVSSDLSLP